MLVESGDGADAVVGEGAQDLDDGLFISAEPRHRVVKLLSVEVRQRGHESYDDVFQVARELALQFADEVLLK